MPLNIAAPNTQKMKTLSFAALFLMCTFSAYSQYKWKTFNSRNGSYKIDLPDFFSDGGIIASGIHYYNTAFDENISVWVEGIGQVTSSDLANDYLDAAKQKNISYKVIKPTFYVVSGMVNPYKNIISTQVKSYKTYFKGVTSVKT